MQRGSTTLMIPLKYLTINPCLPGYYLKIFQSKSRWISGLERKGKRKGTVATSTMKQKKWLVFVINENQPERADKQ
jgi:hypothetical protein